MNLITLDQELNKHMGVSFIKSGLSAEFEPKIQEILMRKHSTDGYIVTPDVTESVLLYQKMMADYATSMQESAAMVKSLFANNKLSFRLYDHAQVLHATHRICLIWVVAGKEYSFEFTFEDQNNVSSIPFLCRMMEVEIAGPMLRGDTVYQAKDLDGVEMYDWFLDALKSNIN